LTVGLVHNLLSQAIRWESLLTVGFRPQFVVVSGLSVGIPFDSGI
jgi:hypothetical protein